GSERGCRRALPPSLGPKAPDPSPPSRGEGKKESARRPSPAPPRRRGGGGRKEGVYRVKTRGQSATSGRPHQNGRDGRPLARRALPLSLGPKALDLSPLSRGEVKKERARRPSPALARRRGRGGRNEGVHRIKARVQIETSEHPI